MADPAPPPTVDHKKVAKDIAKLKRRLLELNQKREQELAKVKSRGA